MKNIYSQMVESKIKTKVDVKINDAPKPRTTGRKRQELLQRAQGKYVVWIDDDDQVAPSYIENMVSGCLTGADCLAINGTYSIDGGTPLQWFISKDYTDHDTYK